MYFLHYAAIYVIHNFIEIIFHKYFEKCSNAGHHYNKH